VNSEVDPVTRNVRVRATFPNKEGILRPGLFVNVEVSASDQREVVIIPATAVVYAPTGTRSSFSTRRRLTRRRTATRLATRLR